jgi:putative PEP-CTERM system integral membrane protein
MKTALHLLSHAIFWTWNLGFLGVVYLWILPAAGFAIFEAARDGTIPPTFLLSIIGILVVPLICTVLGGLRLRKHPILLMRLFYGVEAPLFTLCLLRLFLIREMTTASAYVLGLLLFSIAMFTLETLAGYAAYRRGLAWVQIIGHSLLLITGLYIGALLLLYTVPALCIFIYNLFEFTWLYNLGWYVLHPFILLFGASCLVFFSLPYVMVNFYVRSWHRIFSAFGKQFGYHRSWLTTVTLLGLSCLLFLGLQQQPQAQAFDLLQTPPQTPHARQVLLQQSETIRAGLTNAYLSRYRYLSPWEESNQLREMYSHVFDLPRSTAQGWQNLHNGLLSPFLYQGSSDDVEKAADLYAAFFDTPIQKGERPAIRQALQATANRDETQAGLLNLDQKIVHLASQAVTVREQGDWAEVELHERYENSTLQDQEIFYSFSLPESAVITGLWLGKDEESPRFPFVVSPRGAAQQVYQGEVERSKFNVPTDPALLEQVGPQQYRLRVFPIPPATSSSEPGQLHLWMTYQVMQRDGTWPLPQLTEKRNIFWTGETRHTRSSKSVTLPEDQWFEAAIPAEHKVSAKTYVLDFAEGYRVTVTPVSAQAQALPTQQHLAVILDGSYSMANHPVALNQAFQQLAQVATSNAVDFYETNATGVSPAPTQDLKAFEQTVFYGSLQPADMLQQFEQQHQQYHPHTPYDAILLLTDNGSYELAEATALPTLSAPLWLIHLGGQLPAAYEDTLLQALQTSRGGVSGDVLAALARLNGAATDNVLDGYVWSVSAIPEPITEPLTADDPGFEPLAARQWIWQHSRTRDMTQIEALDRVHAIAKRTAIVTPYSSMLVLVDDRQRELLRQAEAAADRFDREVEKGEDELTDPANPLNAVSVPEAGQILGLSTIAVGLILLKRRHPRSSL